MMYSVRKLPHPWNLRVEENGEVGKGGLDAFEHGTSSYAEDVDDNSIDGLFEKTQSPLPA
ncbi:hypothetical protein [Arcticibacter eurypsychrophilus]|uniref:hypothetical protein n=1 Tax=Arcticibacter eurypsychrophilus TaxID=1434752 RepID=UPI001112D75D|nr:hypothetical protein [Arcticibacter eurypsychrophilus]